jgi:hypothetical protein
MLWQTGEGIFTLMHRPPMEGKPNHFIAYITKVPADGLSGDAEDSHIVHPDATVTTDAGIMFPTDSEICD